MRGSPGRAACEQCGSGYAPPGSVMCERCWDGVRDEVERARAEREETRVSIAIGAAALAGILAWLATAW